MGLPDAKYFFFKLIGVGQGRRPPTLHCRAEHPFPSNALGPRFLLTYGTAQKGAQAVQAGSMSSSYESDASDRVRITRKTYYFKPFFVLQEMEPFIRHAYGTEGVSLAALKCCWRWVPMGRGHSILLYGLQSHRRSLRRDWG